jgi:SAM-dependent methyltransferase
MFSATARYYDAFYDAVGKDYEHETAELVHRVRARNTGARTLLDVACGTGRHVEHLSREFRCVGVDIEPALLAMAAARCPGVRFIEADMVQLNLGESFDVVTCLFSSIGYVRTPDALNRAIAAMASHLTQDGVLIVEPSFDPDGFEGGRMNRIIVDSDDLMAVRMNTSARRGDVAILDMHYLIGTGGEISYLHERHELGLFTLGQYRRAFEQAGLEVEAEQHGLIGRGLLIGARSI